MAYKQPKNTPIHSYGASEPISAAIIGVKAAVTAVKVAKAAKLASAGIKAAKVAKLAATAAKAGKAAKVAATAAKATKAAKASKLALKAGKVAKAGKAAKAARITKRAAKVGDKAVKLGQKASQKVLSKGVKAGEKATKIQGKMDTKLISQVNKQMGKSLKSGEKAVSKTAKAGEKAANQTAKAGERAANKTAKQAGKMAEGKAPTFKEGVKDLYNQGKNKISQGVEKYSNATGKDYSEVMGNVKKKAIQGGITQTQNLVQKQKAKTDTSTTSEDLIQPLGVVEEAEPAQQTYPTQERPSSYSNPSGASMKTNIPSGYKSSAASNQKTPATKYQKFMGNLANNSVNANIGGVKVNVGHIGLIAGNLIGSGVDAIKAKKSFKALKRREENTKESATKAEEEKKNKNIMQNLDDENKMENLKG